MHEISPKQAGISSRNNYFQAASPESAVLDVQVE